MAGRTGTGTTVGMSHIKERRLTRKLRSHPGLTVGSCVPFYFCPRSVMLYILHKGNHSDLAYRGGQGPIVHLKADLAKVVSWADEEELRWAFTDSNAGSMYFEDRVDLSQLADLDWAAINATSWQEKRDGKQAEFLVENRFPWALVEEVGVQSGAIHQRVEEIVKSADHQPATMVRTRWYY